MNRRGFMRAILAAGVAPYVCTTAGVLMPVKASRIWLWGDGVHDDTLALQALLDGRMVSHGRQIETFCGENVLLSGGVYRITSILTFHSDTTIKNAHLKYENAGYLFQKAPVCTWNDQS